jgi:uncharacterized metal-binding protein
MHDQNNIQRLGFTAWADNLIVNAIEDLGDKRPYDYDVESEDVTIVLRQIGDEITATVRAYIPGQGWYYHDRTIKIKEGKLL